MKSKENISDRKKYMSNAYSKFWINVREKKGFQKYDKNLVRYIIKNLGSGGRLLEVAIGTGYPFADYFQKKGYDVYGIDISPLLVEKCKKINPNINCTVSDAERLPYKDNYFDATYCFHSTWYFPDLIKVISEMIRVTVPKGLVIFDIMNLNNRIIYKNYHKNLNRYNYRYLYYPVHFFKNIIKIILNYKGISWKILVYSTPTKPEDIINFLNEKKISYKIFVRREDESIEFQNKISSFENYFKVVFAISK